MEVPGTLTHDIAVERLTDPNSSDWNPFCPGHPERHSWHIRSSCDEEWMSHGFAGPADKRAASLWHKPLLRVWDRKSGSIPNPRTRRMLARDTGCLLNSVATRKEMLELHLDYRNTEHATPFISFTSSPGHAGELASIRASRPRRGAQSLTLVDPRTRFRLGLPVLDFSIEKTNYQVESRYGVDYTPNHWLCLWEVTPAEVVHTWEWAEFGGDPHWYERIVEPALLEFQSTGLRPGEAIIAIMPGRQGEDDEESDQEGHDEPDRGDDEETDQPSNDDRASGDELVEEMKQLGL